jgi:hypothetical protein
MFFVSIDLFDVVPSTVEQRVIIFVPDVGFRPFNLIGIRGLRIEIIRYGTPNKFCPLLPLRDPTSVFFGNPLPFGFQGRNLGAMLGVNRSIDR